MSKGIKKITMKTQLLFNGWWAHYHPNCWFRESEDTQYLNEEGRMVGFRPKEEGITMEKAYKKSKTEMRKKKKNNPKWMKYWDNVNVELYALIKQIKKKKNE